MRKALIFIVALTLFLAACQPTPEEPVIVTKNKDLVQEIIEANQEENQEALAEDKEVIKQQVEETGRHIAMQIEPVNTIVKINVDADVMIPADMTMPFVRLKPANFTAEQFKAFAEYFAQGNELYYSNDKSSLSKEEIQGILLSLGGYLSNNALPEHIKTQINLAIDSLNDLNKKALSKSQEIPFTGELVAAENNKAYSTITNLKAYMGHDLAAEISLWQSKNATATKMGFVNSDYNTSYNIFEDYTGVPPINISISYNEAKQIAMDAVHALDGLDSNLVITSSSICYEVSSFCEFIKETAPNAYRFVFSRSYNGAPTNYITPLHGMDTVNYREQIGTEVFIIKIDDTGIVTCSWRNYQQCLEQIAGDVPLLAFDEIIDTFENQCKYQFAWIPNYDNLPERLGATVDIMRIELNLMATAERDSINTYLLIPVWDFIGDVTYSETVFEDGYEVPAEKNVSILTINAIDGSIINRQQGY